MTWKTCDGSVSRLRRRTAWWVTVWSVEAVQVRVTALCSAEAWRLVGCAGGIIPGGGLGRAHLLALGVDGQGNSQGDTQAQYRQPDE